MNSEQNKELNYKLLRRGYSMKTSDLMAVLGAFILIGIFWAFIWEGTQCVGFSDVFCF